MTKQVCPISMAEVLNALCNNKFKPFTEQDYIAFADAAADAMIWMPEKKGANGEELLVIVSPFDEGGLGIEVYLTPTADDGEGQVWAVHTGEFKRIN